MKGLFRHSVLILFISGILFLPPSESGANYVQSSVDSLRFYVVDGDNDGSVSLRISQEIGDVFYSTDEMDWTPVNKNEDVTFTLGLSEDALLTYWKMGDDIIGDLKFAGKQISSEYGSLWEKVFMYWGWPGQHTKAAIGSSGDGIAAAAPIPGAGLLFASGIAGLVGIGRLRMKGSD